MKIYTKTMKTQNTKNLTKPIVFLFFLLKKQGSRDGPGTPGAGPPETDFHSKTCTKVDFSIKPKIKQQFKNNQRAPNYVYNRAAILFFLTSTEP